MDEPRRPARFPASLPHLTDLEKPRPKPQATLTARGLGLDSDAIRRRMIERLVARGIGNPLIWEALWRVPRHLFVDPALASQAYEDAALPIGHEQTISKPSSVATLLAAIGVQPDAPKLRLVLDIGTGCGYQAAVLAQVCERVCSVERIGALHAKAKLRLTQLGMVNVECLHVDANELPRGLQRFDGIVSAAAGHDVPADWLGRLKPGAALVAPVGDFEQQLVRYRRASNAGQAQPFEREVLDGAKFVPLKLGKVAR